MINDEKIFDDNFIKDVDFFESKIKEYIKEKILLDYIAYYIYNCYKMNLVTNENLNALLEASIDSLSQINVIDCNIEKIKNILINNYKLNVINDEPIKIINC